MQEKVRKNGGLSPVLLFFLPFSCSSSPITPAKQASILLISGSKTSKSGFTANSMTTIQAGFNCVSKEVQTIISACVYNSLEFFKENNYFNPTHDGQNK